MSRIPRQARRDRNEPAIVQMLEAGGCSVIRHSAAGEPDLFVFTPHGFLALVEVKSQGGTLTDAQIRWRARWRGPAPVTCRTVEDVAQLLKVGAR